jgi:predicted phage tail protein
MSENNAEATATETPGTEQQSEAQKPTETVDFWKAKAREQEKRAKENAEAAKRLSELEDAQKSETEKAADRIAKAEAEVASLPTKVADALRTHLVALHEIDKDDAELFLTATDPELLLKQVTRLIGQSDKRKKTHVVPGEGKTPSITPGDADRRAFVRQLTGRE